MKRLLAILLLVLGLPALIGLVFLAKQIEGQSNLDEAKQADVIVVLGAAEYNGRPSPVLRARLDHALELHRRGLAPRILTTGGSGDKSTFTEGEVGRDYLILKGIPAEDIVVEEKGVTTVSTMLAVAEIMRRMGMTSAILVSDGYHIFRSKKILEDAGVMVYGSPRPSRGSPGWHEEWLYMRQAVGYVLWWVGITV